jgi:ParB family transcriptional regulator, chromosome partitioning protein
MARNALGRGLSALIREPGLAEPNAPAYIGDMVSRGTPGVADGSAAGSPGGAAPGAAPGAGAAASAAASALAAGSEIVMQVDVDLIDPSPHQPRLDMNDNTLNELAQSIRISGVIQPVLLRRKGQRYELIAGERRWRAAQRASLQRVPALVRDVPDDRAMEITLVENLQREDLNPVEEALALDRLMHDFGMTQDQVAERTGKSRSAISNALRLLRLDIRVQGMVSKGEISAGHARALATIIDPVTQFEAAQQVAKGRLTVRQIERMTYKSVKPPPPGSVSVTDPNVKHMLSLMEQKYGTKVAIKPFVGGKGGQLVFYYYENEYLGTLYDLLMIEH